MSVYRSMSSASPGGGSVLPACGARSCTAVLVVTHWGLEIAVKLAWLVVVVLVLCLLTVV